jgi:hypothetical protein
MVTIPKDIMDIIAAPDSTKMMATVDEQGFPNIATVGSITAIDSETIAFAELFIKKTKENLENVNKVAIIIFKGPMVGYQLKGTFAGFQTSGPIFESFSEKVMSAMKLQIKSVGIIKVDDIFEASPGKDSKKLA